MVRERMYQAFGLLLAAVLATGLASQLGQPIPVALAAPQLAGTAADQLNAAAAAVESALAKGGSGLTFEVIQRNSVRAKPGGPPIYLRGAEDPATVVGETDVYEVNAIVSRGAITADAFWMEMRVSPTTDAPADFATASFFARVVARDGQIWRDDGAGWYVTDVSPGTGMDPVTARLLPKLLRSMTDADVLSPAVIDGRLLAGVRAIARVDDYPGVVASDGKAFTSPSFEIHTWLDDAGRAVRLETTANNLNASEYDHVSATVVTFGYGPTGDPPSTSPTLAPQPLPTSEPEAVQVQS